MNITFLYGEVGNYIWWNPDTSTLDFVVTTYNKRKPQKHCGRWQTIRAKELYEMLEPTDRVHVTGEYTTVKDGFILIAKTVTKAYKYERFIESRYSND